jgi:hypothetical protein
LRLDSAICDARSTARAMAVRLRLLSRGFGSLLTALNIPTRNAMRNVLAQHWFKAVFCLVVGLFWGMILSSAPAASVEARVCPANTREYSQSPQNGSHWSLDTPCCAISNEGLFMTCRAKVFPAQAIATAPASTRIVASGIMACPSGYTLFRTSVASVAGSWSAAAPCCAVSADNPHNSVCRPQVPPTSVQPR